MTDRHPTPAASPDPRRKAVLLDLDDTILDFRRAEDFALRRTLLETGITPDDGMVSLYSAINDAQWKKLEKGLASRDEILTDRFRRFLEAVGQDRPAAEIRGHYERNLSETDFLLPGAKALLNVLSARYRLFILSHGTSRVQHGRIARTGIARFFEAIFLSEEIGCPKPDPRFFDRCFAAVPDLSRADAVLVGDSLTSDIQGGKNAGLPTVWYNPHGKTADGVRPDRTVTDLSEIPDAVRELLFP